MPFVFVLLDFFQPTLFWNPSILLCDVVISKWLECIIPLGDFPSGSVVKNCLPSRRCGFHPWVGEIPRRRKWQPPLVFLPGRSHGQRNLSPWGHKRVRHNLAIKDTHIILFSFPPLSRHSGSPRFGCYTSGVYVGALAQQVEFLEYMVKTCSVLQCDAKS